MSPQPSQREEPGTFALDLALRDGYAFTVVTQSVRAGLDVQVDVVPQA